MLADDFLGGVALDALGAGIPQKNLLRMREALD
jgi:hypothetical protein